MSDPARGARAGLKKNRAPQGARPMVHVREAYARLLTGELLENILFEFSND